ncbi:MAG: UDP-N-acetylmuramoyl-L-alanyl-D-glutamate--2,6-diaminopimelate ligase [Anaerolineales bacterium]|nr:UDP-N-acetylmuramoyl-L-alanyl-D-glutamate--2,6-diaminopimelate ligase [Anaerolineales bacterium]
MPDKTLSELIQGLPGDVSISGLDVAISGVVLDSRKVQAGSLFVACPGETADGHRYIQDAIQRGAAAVVGVERVGELSVPYVRVKDSCQALAYLAAAYYGFPARQLMVIGVTGTDGKTTTANLIYQILQAAGLRAGMISTVNAVIGDQELDTGFHVTTPDSPDVQRYLSQMVQAGLTHVVLEATSHGLAQQRVAACDFDLGVVTNITHEHLDYHGSYQAYRAAKGLLFTSLASTPDKAISHSRGAVLNRDDSSFDYLYEMTSLPRISYGFDARANVRPEQILFDSSGLRFTALGRDQDDREFSLQISANLVGDYNVSNCLAAIAATRGLMRLEDAAVQAGISHLPGVAGRMERIDLGQDFTAIVDFAHTPNALRRTLQAARRLTHGKVIAVFGSAGLRDRQKRRMMAETSAELADYTILTAEDPRSESLEVILAEMVAGVLARGGLEANTFWRIPDRGEAIRFAVQMAQKGDLVIACGKGHEQSMCFGAIEYAWDDRTAMRAALAELLGAAGPPMPRLPTSAA